VLGGVDSAELTSAEEDMLMEIRNDRTLKVRHASTNMASFWLYPREEYPIITKAIATLLDVSTSYLCEAGFSAMDTTKSKTRSGLQTLKEDLRVCLSTIRHHGDHQAQVSH
jgi:hypothetical protein